MEELLTQILHELKLISTKLDRVAPQPIVIKTKDEDFPLVTTTQPSWPPPSINPPPDVDITPQIWCGVDMASKDSKDATFATITYFSD